MLLALISLSSLGLILGLILGLASRHFHVETIGMQAELEAMLPGTNCGQCGYPGCAGAATALANGEADASCCPPGGKQLATQLAERLGLVLNADNMNTPSPQIALVREDICIGCTKCFKVCPTDAVLGAAKQIHAVIREACTGCAKCEHICPTGAIELEPVPVTPQSWVWPHPEQCRTAPMPA